MKRIFLTFLLLFTLAAVSNSCRDEKTTTQKVEIKIDEVEEGLEGASNDVQDAAEDLQDKIDEATEELNDND